MCTYFGKEIKLYKYAYYETEGLAVLYVVVILQLH